MVLKMQFEVLEREGDSKLVLHVRKASVAWANALRRTIIGGLPSFAIDEVDFYENNSPFFNEFIANRLGLIPLTFDELVPADAKISISCNASGPLRVYSKDLVSADERVGPTAETFPIVDLGEGQVLRLEGWAVMGVAKKHAKFQCAHASYGHYPVFKVKKNSPKLKEFIDALPAACKDSKGEPVAYKCDALEHFAQENTDIAEFSFKEDEFVFRIESYNNVPAKEHLVRALETIKEEAKEARKLL